jgi:hypothetical protein
MNLGNIDAYKLACPDDDEPLEEAEEVCLECVRHKLRIQLLELELKRYRCSFCDTQLPVRALQLVSKTGTFCNTKCLGEYDSAMRDVGW